MKTIKLIMAFVLLLAAMVVTYGQADTVVIAEPTGFWGFYEKYKEAIYIVLASLGVTGFFWYRVERIKTALQVTLAAGDDTSPEGRKVTQEEWQGIVKAYKAIWGKKEDKK